MKNNPTITDPSEPGNGTQGETFLFQPKDLIAAYPEITRNRLDFWKRNRQAKKTPLKMEAQHRPPQPYPEDQLPFIATLNRGYQIGLSAEQIARAIESPDSLRRYVSSSLATLGLRLETEVLGQAAEDLPGRVAAETTALLKCEKVWLFEQSENAENGEKDWRLRYIGAMRMGSSSTSEAPPGMYEFVCRESGATRPINMYGSKLLRAFSAVMDAGPLHSMLAAPVAFNAAPARFFMIAQNKLDRNGLPNRACIFDLVDEAAITLISQYFAAAWRSTIVQGLQSAIKALDSASFIDVMRIALSTAAKATGAFRGDATMWDPHRQGMVLEVTIGGLSASSRLKDKSLLGNPSISRWVFEHKIERYAPDVKNDPFYLPCNGRTRSEFAVPIHSSQFRDVIAVLNLEAERENGFSEQDKSIARLCVDTASQWVQLADTKDTIVSRLLDSGSSASGHSTLENVRAEISDEFGYPQVLVYLARAKTAVLEVCAPAGANFRFDLKERSLATKVFADGTRYYCSDPRRDLFLAPRGIKHFSIDTPVLGVPLKAGALVIGVVVLFGRTQPEPHPAAIDELEAFVEDCVSGARSQAYEAAMKSIRELGQALNAAKDAPAVIGAVLRAILGVGLDRARLFELVNLEESSFLCVGSRGCDPQNRLDGVLIVKCDAVRFINKEGHRNYMARRFHPTENPFSDPNADRLLKPADLPFVNAPIWNGKENLVGYLAGDNKSNPKRRITKLQSDSLEIIASLAAPALAYWFRSGSALEDGGCLSESREGA